MSGRPRPPARRWLPLVATALLAAGCTAVPRGAYFAPPSAPGVAALAQSLYRAAQAAGDDPARYGFAMVATREIRALNGDDGVFYFSEGLARLPAAQMDALVAQAVAHEILDHAGTRRRLSLGLSAGFTAVGLVVPGLGLADLVVNPLVVRAFTRDQEVAADRRAVEILRAMGYEQPRRVLAAALRAAAVVNGPPAGGLLAREPALDDRLALLDPLEPAAETAATAPTAPR